MPDDSETVKEQKRTKRQLALRQLQTTGGRAVSSESRASAAAATAPKTPNAKPKGQALDKLPPPGPNKGRRVFDTQTQKWLTSDGMTWK